MSHRLLSVALLGAVAVGSLFATGCASSSRDEAPYALTGHSGGTDAQSVRREAARGNYADQRAFADRDR